MTWCSMPVKTKTDRRVLAVYKLAEENNIKNVNENILKPAFNSYCDCGVSMAFIDIDKDEMMNYIENTCLPILEDEFKQRIKAETILNN